MPWQTITDLALQGVACEYCGARPGHRCRTVVNRAPARFAGVPTALHVDRVAVVRQAYAEGYADGLMDADDAHEGTT